MEKLVASLNIRLGAVHRDLLTYKVHALPTPSRPGSAARHRMPRSLCSARETRRLQAGATAGRQVPQQACPRSCVFTPTSLVAPRLCRPHQTGVAAPQHRTTPWYPARQLKAHHDGAVTSREMKALCWRRAGRAVEAGRSKGADEGGHRP